MYLKSLELSGFKSFPKKTQLSFTTPVTAVVGPNGSGKSNIVESLRFVLGEQRMTQMRGKRTEDLIWNGSHKASRSSRASVKLTFDNSGTRGKKLFDVDFDEVTIERVIYRDASTEYMLNGSPVRLKDIVELLAEAHIGTSGHHIISQGETDRILNVNARERKGMVEDALGLKIYHYRKEESVRKLERTQQNIKEVESLRREIKPHISFLKSQLEKVEKARSLREKLRETYEQFFAIETKTLSEWELDNENKKADLNKEKARVEKELREAKEVLERLAGDNDTGKAILEHERELSAVRKEKEALTLERGRLEGQIDLLERQERESGPRTLPAGPVSSVFREISELVEKAETDADIGTLKAALSRIKQIVASFRERVVGADSGDEERKRAELGARHKELGDQIEVLVRKEEKHMREREALSHRIEQSHTQVREAERKVFTASNEQADVARKLEMLSGRERECSRRAQELADERREAAALVGAVREIPAAAFSESEQTKLRKDLERLKIRVEEAGGGGSEEIEREYQEVSDRDAHFERELADLEQSAEKLRGLISELNETLEQEFKTGLTKINSAFQELFALMFGGGTAKLVPVQEETRRREDIEVAEILETKLPPEEPVLEEGVELDVSLPRKKVRGLDALSGGERALTSVALLFALSQVNPPPFLVLDETDAALDEANSHRYGDMIERLAEHSQLILITHNRETMSRAGVLYGVTMGADGASQLLSVGFEGAVETAK